MSDAFESDSSSSSDSSESDFEPYDLDGYVHPKAEELGPLSVATIPTTLFMPDVDEERRTLFRPIGLTKITTTLSYFLDTVTQTYVFVMDTPGHVTRTIGEVDYGAIEQIGQRILEIDHDMTMLSNIGYHALMNSNMRLRFFNDNGRREQRITRHARTIYQANVTYNMLNSPITQQTHVQLSTFAGGELEMMIELGQKWLIDRNCIVTLSPTAALSATEFLTFLRRVSKHSTPLVVEYSRRSFVSALIEFERMLTSQLARSCFIQFPAKLRAFIHNDRLVFAHYDEQDGYGYLLASVSIEGVKRFNSIDNFFTPFTRFNYGRAADLLKERDQRVLCDNIRDLTGERHTVDVIFNKHESLAYPPYPTVHETTFRRTYKECSSTMAILNRIPLTNDRNDWSGDCFIESILYNVLEEGERPAGMHIFGEGVACTGVTPFGISGVTLTDDQLQYMTSLEFLTALNRAENTNY